MAHRPKFISVTTAARLLQVSPCYVRRLVGRGEIPGLKLTPRAWAVERLAIERLAIERQQAATAAAEPVECQLEPPALRSLDGTVWPPEGIIEEGEPRDPFGERVVR